MRHPRSAISSIAIARSMDVMTELQRLLSDKIGVKVEDLLAAIGSLGGFSCQMRLHALAHESGQSLEDAGLIEVTADNGTKYYMAEAIEEALFYAEHSFWRQAYGAAQEAGCATFDLEELVNYTAESLGTNQFAIPRFPRGHEATHLPKDYIRQLWEPIQKVMSSCGGRTEEWTLVMGLTAARAIEMTRNFIAPHDALGILMECAIPSAKLNPTSVGIITS